MNFKYASVLCVLAIVSCTTIPTIESYGKTFNDVTFEANGCSISPNKIATCSLKVTSHNRDRTIAIGNGASLQDNGGEGYSASVRFGEGSWQKTLIANAPYDLNITVENVSTKATSIRAIIINRLDISLGPKQHLASHSNVIFSNPKMLSITKASASPTLKTKFAITPEQTNSVPEIDGSSFEVGIDRPQGDMGIFVLDTPDAKLCLDMCKERTSCKAWTYVKPGVQGIKANCWLKNIVPQPLENPNTISGVMKR